MNTCIWPNQTPFKFKVGDLVKLKSWDTEYKVIERDQTVNGLKMYKIGSMRLENPAWVEEDEIVLVDISEDLKCQIKAAENDLNKKLDNDGFVTVFDVLDILAKHVAGSPKPIPGVTEKIGIKCYAHAMDFIPVKRLEKK